MIARALLACVLLCWPFAAAADVAVPPLSGRVVDQTGTLSASDAAALTQRLKDLETRKGSQVAVLIVPTTQPETIEQFSIRVAEAWKIGRKKIDDGALLSSPRTTTSSGSRSVTAWRARSRTSPRGASSTKSSRRASRPAILPAEFRPASTASSASSMASRCRRQSPKRRTAPTPSTMFFDIVFSPFGFLGYAAIAAILRGRWGGWSAPVSPAAWSARSSGFFSVRPSSPASSASSPSSSRCSATAFWPRARKPAAMRAAAGGGWSTAPPEVPGPAVQAQVPATAGFPAVVAVFGGGGASGSW